jgi:hypothetical protein
MSFSTFSKVPLSAENVEIVFVTYGNTSQNLNLDNLSIDQGFIISHNSTCRAAIGFSLTNSGDVNMDGLDDILIGSRTVGTYVLYGVSGGSVSDINLGYAVAGNMDVNQDGIADIAIGCPGDIYGRYVYVVYGKRQSSEWHAMDVTAMGGYQGMAIASAGRERTSYVIANVGDVNGDTFNDIGIGSSASVYPGTSNACGAVHLVTNIYDSSTSAPTLAWSGNKTQTPTQVQSSTYNSTSRPTKRSTLSPSRIPSIMDISTPSINPYPYPYPSLGEVASPPPRGPQGDNIRRGKNVTWSEVRNACAAIGVLMLVCLCCCGIAYVRKAMRNKDWYLEAEITLQNTLSISKQMNAHPVFSTSHFYSHIHYLFSEDAEVQLMVHDVLTRNIDNTVMRECVKDIYKCVTAHNTLNMDYM